MTNVFGSAAPALSDVELNDTGPLQLGHGFRADVPVAVSHVRYYVASTEIAANTGGSVTCYAWRKDEPDSIVSATMTIPATVGWVTAELPAALLVPVDREFGVAISLPAGTQAYGSAFNALPASNVLITCTGSNFLYSATQLNPYSFAPHLGTSYLLDVEVAVSELVNVAPGDLAVSDKIQVFSQITGTVNSVTPGVDSIVANVLVAGGPLDGTSIDVWLPDTVEGLASATMKLYRETDDPDLLTLWESADGAVWVYQGAGAYMCVFRSALFAEGSKTRRIDTPSLTEWTP